MSSQDEIVPPECACKECVAGCHRKPGWFLPGEAEKVADHMGIELKEFFDTYLVADFWYRKPEQGGPVFLLSPAMGDTPPGGVGKLDPSGRCVFLDENERCRIHVVKPYECKMAISCRREQYGKSHQEVALAWEGEPQKQVEVLLGKKPELPDTTMGEALLFALKTMKEMMPDE